MDYKRLEFPCTKKCLVYASCSRVCWPYADYVQEAFREQKYRCFKIIPPPPKQIQHIAKIMNRVEGDNIKFSYYPAEDMLIVSDKISEGIIKVVGRVRKRKDIFSISTFPGRHGGTIWDLLNSQRI